MKKEKEFKLKQEEYVEPGFALVRENNKLITIRSAKKHTAYKCPECGNIIRKRGGPKRRDHFYHAKGGGNCKITYESNLHKCAKIYLRELLESHTDFNIFIELSFFEEGFLTNALKKFGIQKIGLSVNSFFDNLLLTHTVEKGIGEYVADVLSESGDKTFMAWEILVTSEIKTGKLEHFIKNQIPFIELEPVEFGKEDFHFNLKNYGNFELLKLKQMPEIDFENISYQDLKIWLETSGLKTFFENREEIVRNKLFGDLDEMNHLGIPLLGDLDQNLSPYDRVNAFLKEKGKIEINQTFIKRKYPTEKVQTENLTTIRLNNDKGFPILKLNGKSPDSPINFSGEFFKQLAKRFSTMASINADNEICRIKMNFMDSSFRKHEISIDEHTESIPLNHVNLSLMEFSKNNHGYPCYKIVNPKIDKDSEPFDLPEAELYPPLECCYRFLKELNEIANLKIIIRKTVKNYLLVTGIVVEGIYSSRDFDHYITDGIMERFRRILFYNSFLMFKAESDSES
ncbi:MAG: hypothetical protein ACQETH_14285 [Candidatus Rifleibacteriota bacterium]